jgi:hypothetical protein
MHRKKRRLEQIDRILSKDFKWKTYWNRPLTLFFLLSGSIMLILFFYYWVLDSETLWGFFMLLGTGFYFCGIVLFAYYFIGGPLVTTIDSMGSGVTRTSNIDPTRMGPHTLYTKIDMSLDLMQLLRSYLIDRYIRPVVNKETDRWIIMKFKNENQYRYDKRKGILTIHRGKRTRDMLDLEYYDIFTELKTWNKKKKKK